VPPVFSEYKWHYLVDEFIRHSKIIDCVRVSTFMRSSPTEECIRDGAVDDIGTFHRRVASAENRLY
jgi:hypothetical protein